MSAVSEVQSINKGKITRLASLAVGISVLVAFIYFVGVGSVVHVLLQVNPTVILAMVAIQLLGFTFYATAWYALIRSTGSRLPFLTCQGITFASIFASYTMPSGIFLEAVRCILASKESGMTLGESTATVILHRVLYIVGFLASTSLAFVVLILGGRRYDFSNFSTGRSAITCNGRANRLTLSFPQSEDNATTLGSHA